MWQELWFLVLTSLRTTLRKRSNLILFLGLPIAGILLSVLIYGGGSSNLRVGIVNEDGQETIAADTARFVQGLANVKVTALNESELRQQLAAGKLDSGLVLGAGYSHSVLAGKPDHVSIESVKGAQVTAYMKAMLYGYIDNVATIGRVAAGDPAKFKQLYDRYQSAPFQVTAQSVNDTSQTKEMSYQSIGFLLMFMMMSAISLSELLLKSRENRTYFRILSSPIEAKTYVASNIVVSLVIMLIQVVVSLFFMRVVFRLDPGMPIPAMIGVLALFSLVSVGLSLAIVAFSKSSAAAGAMQNLIVTPTCLLAGCFFPIDIMPAPLRRVADFLPQNWVLQSFAELQSGKGFSAIGFDLAILVAFAVVFFLIAAYKLARNNDTRNFV